MSVPAAPVARPAGAHPQAPARARGPRPVDEEPLFLCDDDDEGAATVAPSSAAPAATPGGEPQGAGVAGAAPPAVEARDAAADAAPAPEPQPVPTPSGDPLASQDRALAASAEHDDAARAGDPQAAPGAGELAADTARSSAAGGPGVDATPEPAAGGHGPAAPADLGEEPAAKQPVAKDAAAGRDGPTGDDDVFATGGGQPTVDGDGAAAVAAMRQRAMGHVAALPPPRVAGGGRAAPVETEAQRRARLTDLGTSQTAASAQAQVPPVPAELASPPAPTDENPVPNAMFQVNQIGSRRLETQTPPALPPGTPLGNPLRLTARPVSEAELARAHEVRPPVLVRTPPGTHPAPAAAQPAADSEEARQAAAQAREQQQALDLRNRMLNPPAPPAGQGQPTALVDAPPRHVAVTPGLRGQAADVYARLLAQPEQQASSLFGRVQRGVFGSAAGGGSDVGDYGREQFLPELQRDFERSVRDIATASGIATRDLDQAIADRRTRLAEEAAAAATAVDQAGAAGTAAITAAGEHRQVAVAGQHARLLAQAEATAAQPSAGIGGGVAATRDRLIADLRAREAEIDAGFRLSLRRRERELDDAATAQENAYRAGAQVDHFQLDELANASPAIRTAAAAAYQRLIGAAPATAGELSAGEASTLALRIDAWGQDAGAEARATLTGYKTTVQQATTTNRDALRDAGRAATEEVRDWAAAQLGEHRGWWTQFIEMVEDWIAQLRANADAWRAAQDAETAAATTDDLDFVNRTIAAAQGGISRDELLDGNTLTREQREAVDAVFRAGGSADPIQIVADRTVERIFDSRREGLVSGLTSLFENDGSIGEGQIEALVGGGVAGRAERIHAAMYGRGTWLGLDAIGTDEDAIYENLGGLSPIQMVGLKKIYLKRYGHTLDYALQDEMSGQELQRAQDLASGDAVGAAAAALFSAMHETFLMTGLGTDEKLIHDTLRSLTPEQRAQVEALYLQRYGRNLRDDMHGELDDWATLTTHEADRAEAERQGDLDAADAIELNQISTTTIFHTNDVNEMAAVYERLDREVRAQAQREGRSSYWVAEELARRRGGIEAKHDARYAHLDATGQPIGTLRQEFSNAATHEQQFWGSRPDHRQAGVNLLNALADGDAARAGAARLSLERTSLIYADDKVITDTYRSQYDQALADTRLDREAGIRRRLMEQLERDDRPPHQLTPAERFRRLRQVDHDVEAELQTEARRRSEVRVAAMETAYQNDYHESASTVIEENTSGIDQEMARSLRTQGGYLTPYQRLDYSTRGAGTREEDMINATAGMTRAEIHELDLQWQRTHRNSDGSPQTLADLGEDELSGADHGRYQIAIMGVPQTIDEEIETTHARLMWEWPTSGAGGAVAEHERGLMVDQYNRLVAMRDGMYRTDLTREQRDAYVAAYTQQAEVANTAVDTYRDVRNAIVDSITTMIGVVIGVIVGAILTFLTAGAAALVIVAVIGSLISTAATMATKYLLLGNNYGAGDIGMDLAIGLVDAVVSGLTAGMGGRLLGEAGNVAKSEATQITARGLRGALQRVGAGLGRARSAVGGFLERGSARLGGNEGALTKMLRPSTTLMDMVKQGGLRAEAARFAASMVENLAQSAPSALIGAAANDDVWEGRGNPFGKIVSNTAQSLGPGLAMGAAMHFGMRGFHGALGHASELYGLMRHGPELDVDMHAPRAIETGSPQWHERLAEYRSMWGGEAEARLRSDLDFEHASATERFQMREAQRGPVREHLGELLADDPALAREVPVAVVSDLEFRRLNRMRTGDALVHVGEDGQVRVVVREGAPPAGVRRALEAELPRLREIEPGTGGRIRTGSLEAVLPRDLRGRLPVQSDPSLPPRTVLVVHDPAPRLVVGPGAHASDIRAHLDTARNAVQLHGGYGRVRHLLDRIADWTFNHGEPPVNSRAWEAREELRKLPGVIEARARELQDPGLTAHERAELQADIAHLQEQIAIHERTYAEMDLEPGRGFVAAEGRPVRELPALDAEHAAWTEQMRSFVRGEGPPPPPWTGPEPHLDSHGSWRGFDVREAHAAYKAAIAEGGGAYEAGIFRDRLTGEYTVLLGRRGSVAPPGELPGRSWETVAHFHPNQEGGIRFTLPAQQDVWLAMLASVQYEQGSRPHIEFVDSVLDGRPTRVAIIADSTGMRMELGVGVLGRDAPSAMPIRDPGEGYYRWWGSHDTGGPAPRVARDEGTTWVPPGSMEYRDLLRGAARALGHTEVEAAINATAPERAGIAPGPTQGGTAGPPPARVDTARLDEYPRRVIDDSPLCGKSEVQVVRQVGGDWVESDGVYRYVEAVDSRGRVVASYGETRQNGTGPWVKRGSEINQQGIIGELASEANVRSRLGPHDFMINGQNESGHGFDKVRVAFDEGAVVVENGVPRLRDPDYVPRLVIGEDKLMAQVTLDSITAINPNLIDNLVDKLANRLVDWNEGALASDLRALGIEGPHARFQGEMLLRALFNRNFEFEVTIGNADSLAPLRHPDGSLRAAGDLERLVLHRLRLAIEAKLGGLPVEITRIVLSEAELAQARQTLQAERGIGEPTRVDQALGLPPDQATDAQLRAAWLATLAEDAGALPTGLAVPAVPGQMVTADGQPVRIVPVDPALVGGRTVVPLVRDLMAALAQGAYDPASGRTRPPLVVIDVTGLSPTHLAALADAMRRIGVYRYGTEGLLGIIAIDTATHHAAPLLSLAAAQPPP